MVTLSVVVQVKYIIDVQYLFNLKQLIMNIIFYINSVSNLKDNPNIILFLSYAKDNYY